MDIVLTYACATEGEASRTQCEPCKEFMQSCYFYTPFCYLYKLSVTLTSYVIGGFFTNACVMEEVASPTQCDYFYTPFYCTYMPYVLSDVLTYACVTEGEASRTQYEPCDLRLLSIWPAPWPCIWSLLSTR